VYPGAENKRLKKKSFLRDVAKMSPAYTGLVIPRRCAFLLSTFFARLASIVTLRLLNGVSRVVKCEAARATMPFTHVCFIEPSANPSFIAIPSLAHFRFKASDDTLFDWLRGR
jgi:hypothetical protein